MPWKRSSTKRSEEQHASAAVDPVASDHRDGVAWLALFLTNDELLADACVVDTLTDASSLVAAHQDESGKLLRQKVTRSAAQIMRHRIAQLAATYRKHFFGSEHPPLPEQMLEVLVTYSDEIRSDLNTLCRFVLVLYGIEGYSANDCGRMLGLSTTVVESAYSVAMEAIEMYSCEVLVNEGEYMCASS